jgi:hypothetical protein
MLIQERTARDEPAPGPVRGVAPEALRLRRWVERLAVPRHIVRNTCGNAWVRRELVGALQACGLEVQLQGRFGNVVALPRSPWDSAISSPLTLIAAHYDSVPDCPGADDDASGVAALLECARVLAAGPSRPVGFVVFNAEEEQLAGSRDFVAHGLGAIPGGVEAVHVLEMVGFRAAGAPAEALPLPWTPALLEVPDYVALLARGPSNAILRRAARSRAAPGLRVVSARTWGPLHRLFPDLSRSDHFPFWEAGIGAVLWTDTGNFRNPNYHRPSDVPDTLDYAFMREITELLCAVVSER